MTITQTQPTAYINKKYDIKKTIGEMAFDVLFNGMGNWDSIPENWKHCPRCGKGRPK